MPPGGFDSQALRSARLRAGLTQHQLAVLIGVAGGVRVSRWELGAHTPRPEQAQRAADALGIPLTDLLPNGGSSRDLRDLRLAAGLSVRTVAATLSVSVSTYAHWEGGVRKTVPNEGIVHRLADAFGVHPDQVREAFDQTALHPRYGQPR